MSFEKTVELLQASYNIPASELPGGAASPAPSRPPSAPPADDESVVIIGGRRYKLSSSCHLLVPATASDPPQVAGTWWQVPELNVQVPATR